MSEDSKSKSEAMSGRVLGEESGRSDAAREWARRGVMDAVRHACRVGISDARVTFRAEL